MAKRRGALLQYFGGYGAFEQRPMITALIVLLSQCSSRRRVWEPCSGKTHQTHFSLIYHMPSVSRRCIIKCLAYIICVFIANDMKS